MNNLTVRTLFALVAIPSFIFMLYGGRWAHLILFEALAIGGMWEFARMTNVKYRIKAAQYILPLVVALCVFIMESTHFFPLLFLVWATGFLGLILISFKELEVGDIFPGLAIHGFGFFLFGIWLNISWPLLSPEQGFAASYPFLFVATSMWMCDTGAYFTGKLIGKHKLSPQISPKKTVEGALGGTVACLVWAYFTAPIMLDTSLIQSLFIGVILSFTAPLGDLIFSCMKRYTGFKDSSKIFPGHGGFIDRFDSFYLSAPILAALLIVFKEFPL